MLNTDEHRLSVSELRRDKASPATMQQGNASMWHLFIDVLNELRKELRLCGLDESLTSGLTWRCVGEARPAGGEELTNKDLSEALSDGETEFGSSHGISADVGSQSEDDHPTGLS